MMLIDDIEEDNKPLTRKQKDKLLKWCRKFLFSPNVFIYSTKSNMKRNLLRGKLWTKKK